MGRMHVVAGISAFVVLPLAAATINISLSRTVAWSRMLLLVTGLLPSVSARDLDCPGGYGHASGGLAAAADVPHLHSVDSRRCDQISRGCLDIESLTSATT
jgi:hypothetical protein